MPIKVGPTVLIVFCLLLISWKLSSLGPSCGKRLIIVVITVSVWMSQYDMHRESSIASAVPKGKTCYLQMQNIVFG